MAKETLKNKPVRLVDSDVNNLDMCYITSVYLGGGNFAYQSRMMKCCSMAIYLIFILVVNRKGTYQKHSFLKYENYFSQNFNSNPIMSKFDE